jgi:integrase
MDLVEVKGISKRKKRPRILRVTDAWQILDVLVQPHRTLVLIALCFGLRISEILGLRWTDFDFKRSVVLIQRSAVGKRLNKLKTEYSQDEVPLERGFILELKKWQALCLESEGQWLFPSPVTGRPYHADSIRAD